jgi:hypothetical protein
VAVALGVWLVWASPSDAFRTPDPELVQIRDKALQELKVIEHNCRKSGSKDSAECLVYRKYSHLPKFVDISHKTCQVGIQKACDDLREVAAGISDLVEDQEVSPADPEKPGAHADRAAIREIHDRLRQELPESRAACEESDSRRSSECQVYEKVRKLVKNLDAAPASCRQGNQKACDYLELFAKQVLDGEWSFLLDAKPSSGAPKQRSTDEEKADHPEEPRNQVDPAVCHKARQDYERCMQDAREAPGLSTAASLRMTCAKFLDLCR